MHVLPPDSPHFQAALAVTRRLSAAGHETYFAGGAVRDAIMGNLAQDWDIATGATPEEVEALFARTVPVGRAFGVVIVLSGGYPFEVATFRSDGAYVDGRRPTEIRYTGPREDVMRRDFTVNGLLMAPETGEIIDHVEGLADLEAGVIRAIGDPRARFGEDRLRMLRAVRFAARFGFALEGPTRDAIMEMASMVTCVSGERIRDELEKMLTGPAPAAALGLLDETGLLDVILPDVAALRDVEQPPQFHPEGDVLTHTRLLFAHARPPLHPVLAFAVLLHDVGKRKAATMRKGRLTYYHHEHIGAELARHILKELRCSSALIRDASALVEHHMKLTGAAQLRVATFKRLLGLPMAGDYGDGATMFELLLELNRLDTLASHGNLTDWEDARRRAAEIPAMEAMPSPLVSGDDLIAAGLSPGPAFKTLLDACYEAQLDGLFDDRDGALAHLSTLLPPGEE